MNALISTLTLLIASVAAHPFSTTGHGNAAQYGTGGGIVGFLVLLLDIYIFIEIFKSSRPVERKFLWGVLVFIFPLLGALVYFLFAERAKYNEYTAISDGPTGA